MIRLQRKPPPAAKLLRDAFLEELGAEIARLLDGEARAAALLRKMTERAHSSYASRALELELTRNEAVTAELEAVAAEVPAATVPRMCEVVVEWTVHYEDLLTAGGSSPRQDRSLLEARADLLQVEIGLHRRLESWAGLIGELRLESALRRTGTLLLESLRAVDEVLQTLDADAAGEHTPQEHAPSWHLHG